MLTDGQADAAQAADKDYKLADANGLYLFVTRSGFKSWRMKYRFGGKEKRLTFGAYPEVSLAEARERRDQARRLLRDQIDPSAERSRLRGPGGADEAAVAPRQLPLETASDRPVPAEPTATAVPRRPEAEPLSATRPTPADDAPAAPARAVDPQATDPVPARDGPDAPAGPRDDEGQPGAPRPRSAEPAMAAANGDRPAVAPAMRRGPEPVRAAPEANGFILSSLRAAGSPPPERAVRAGLRATPEPAPPPTPSVVAAPPAPAAEAPLVGAAAGAPAEALPTTAAEPAMDLDAGARALALLRQAEEIAAAAQRESRTARRLALAALGLLVVGALLAAWWLAQPRSPLAAGYALPVGGTAGPIAPPAAAAAPVVPPPAPAAPAMPSPGAPAAGAVPSPDHAATVPPSPLPATHKAAKRRHRRHRHHRHHRVAAAARAPSTHLSREIHHDAQVAAPRRADTIDPDLDRFGRAALCLRAAYSADPGCAAVRATGRQ